VGSEGGISDIFVDGVPCYWVCVLDPAVCPPSTKMDLGQAKHSSYNDQQFVLLCTTDHYLAGEDVSIFWYTLADKFAWYI
jgi:hypothetical protein